MDLLFTYTQDKKDKKNVISTSNLNVFENDTDIKLIGNFSFDFANNIKVDITHQLELNIVTGDFKITHIHKSNSKTTTKIKYNDFKLLYSLVEFGMIRGENTRLYWGSQYRKAVDKVSTIFYNKIKKKFKNEHYHKSLSNHKSMASFLYRLIVNYYLDINDIKSHDGIYNIIEENYPSKKWLKKNDNNFLPAILDSYGIKSKYLIKEININPELKINLKSLRYICNLFGDNHLDYIKQFDWKSCCNINIPFKKSHRLNTSYEKVSMVKIINDLKKSTPSFKNSLQLIYKFLSNKEEINKMGIEIKLKYNGIDSFYKMFDEVNGILKHKKRGYRLRYVFPDEFINTIQEPFMVYDVVYIPKLLTTEEDFIVEGHIMKNCMSTHFSHGIIFIYISLRSDLGNINLQYKKGQLIQSRGKTNIVVDEIYNPAINVISKKLMDNVDIIWTKEKFDIL